MVESMSIHKQDKVCNICGDVGFSEDIVTCCQCNQISEHIYCMQKQPDSNQEYWRCEVCIASNKVPRTKRKSDKNICSNFYERTPVERSSVSSYEKNSEQISVVEKQHTYTQKSLRTQDCSFILPGVGNGISCTTVSAPGTHVKQPISSSTKMVASSKMKFIPDEELMTTREKAKTSWLRQSSGLLLPRTNQDSIMHASVSGRTSRILSSSACSKEVLVQPEGSVIAEVHPLFSKTTSENAVNDMEQNVQNYNASGKGPSGVLCKREVSEEPVSPSVYRSPSKNVMRTKSINNYVTSLRNDEHRKSVKMATSEGHAATIKEEPVEECTKVTVYDSSSKNTVSLESTCSCATPCPTTGGVHNLGMNKFIGNTINSDHRISKSGYQKRGLPSALLIVSDDEHPTHPVEEPLWKGNFEIPDSVPDVYEGIQAHIPAKISLKAYNTLCQLPERIKFKLLRRADVWPRAFHSNPPATDDIGLYFFPCEFHRSKEKYIHLLELINRFDLAMQSCINDVDLLIFSSKQLPKDHQELGTEVFLWGIFHRLKCKKGNPHDQEQFPGKKQCASLENNCGRPNIKLESNSDVDMVEDVDHLCRPILELENYPNFNMVPDTVIERIDVPISVVDTPPGFSEPYTRTIDNEMKSYAHGRMHNRTLSDSPPGFSKPHWLRRGSISVEGVATFSGKDTSYQIAPSSRAEL